MPPGRWMMGGEGWCDGCEIVPNNPNHHFNGENELLNQGILGQSQKFPGTKASLRQAYSDKNLDQLGNDVMPHHSFQVDLFQKGVITTTIHNQHLHLFH